MSNDMKSAFEKAGYKAKEPPGGPPNRANPGQTGRFHLERNYAAQAEEVIQNLKNTMGRDYQNFTTSKIRNILAMVNDIYNDVISEKSDELNADLQSRIEYLKVRLIYESGREPWTVKPFIQKSGLLDLLDDIGDSKERFIKFARYMEALVAYHRFHGGRD